MTGATSAEFARHAWDFRDAALGAERLLGERDEYLLNASLPVAFLFGTCIDLALRSYILAMDSSLTQFASPDCRHDLESLVDEASRLGLARLIRVEAYDLQMLRVLSQLRSKTTCEYSAVQSEEIPIFDSMKKLSEKLLEIACAMAGYERTTYE
ncbi:hypothetical protein [Steroidobacter cummioxidans]|uniref:hypothetical protein n=1 Tax=Steroidobacter cummioxidans TaxID=1803913 RepID=UPI000E31B104|nr:hypothetical protein [Steroidobacter cummioxidans]